MMKRCLLKASYTSYAFWALFVVALAFYIVLTQMWGKVEDINYLRGQQREFELSTTKNSLEINALQNFLSEHSSSQNATGVSAANLQQLLLKYSLAPDSMTVQEQNGQVIYTIEDSTDYFLLQSLLLELCKLHAHVTEISLKAEGDIVHFVVTLSEK